MTPQSDAINLFQEQTGTTFIYLCPPHDNLNELALAAILVITTDNEKFGTRIPFDFVIILGPQYEGERLSAERDQLVNRYLKVLNDSASSPLPTMITPSDFLAQRTSKLTHKTFILVTQRDQEALYS